jgi:hypothetical protein
MNTQHIVRCKDNSERKLLYNYLINNGYEPVEIFKSQNFISNHFPFVIEPNKTFWICESVTCCAAATSQGVMKTVDEFFDIINNKKTQ